MRGPRPLPWRVDHVRLVAADGVTTIAQDSPVTEYTQRAVNAFEDLLAAAHASEFIVDKNGDEYCSICRYAAHVPGCLFGVLDQKHKGWRDWAR